jgi:hypothetical protein
MIRSRLALAAAFGLATTVPAWADSIDGNWCDSKGHTMSISGPTIVTPGGTRMEGRYSRHSFAYTVPERESQAGSAVNMLLMNETTIRLQVNGAEPGEIWHRCEQTS